MAFYDKHEGQGQIEDCDCDERTEHVCATCGHRARCRFECGDRDMIAPLSDVPASREVQRGECRGCGDPTRDGLRCRSCAA